MGGADKAALSVGDVTLLDSVLGAAAPLCSRLVVVGPVRPTTVTDVIFTVEDEPAGGPVPAVLAGLAHVADASAIFVLAVDLPFLSTDGLRRLVTALEKAGTGAVAAGDDRNHPNPLLAVYRADTLRTAAYGLHHAGLGLAASRLLPEDTVVIDLGRRETLNVNTPADLEAANEVAERRR